MTEYIIMLLLGTGMAIIALSLYPKQKSIKDNGITAEGIVYDLAHGESNSFNASYPIV